MPSTLNPQPSTPPQPAAVLRPPSSGRLRQWLPLAAFALLWADLTRQLSYQWSTDDQYAYGWFVPFFALALLFKRWPSRPAASPLRPPVWTAGIVGLLAIAVVPIRLVHEVNPDWPLFSWPLTLFVVGLSLYAVLLVGGWPWVKHFAFPVCFILVAVRWPYRIEHALTQNLMQVVASLTVEVLGWLGVPALQQGNLIELSTGVVGVNEACSGIRSFQSTLMAGLLMGELYRLRLGARAGLVAGGVTLAFCLNVVRALILSWQASKQGLSAIDKWHDPAGMTITIACFVVLWLMAGLLRRRWGLESVPTDTESTAVPQTTAAALPRSFVLGLTVWVACLVLGTELWFRFHENRRKSTVDWTLAFPSNLVAFQQNDLSKGLIKSLKADSGEAGRWQDTGGGSWDAYYFRWRSGSMLSRIQARCHRPEVCFPASGCALERDAGTRVFNVNGIDISFRSYVFNQQGQPLFVFFCLWEDGGENLPQTAKLTYRDRLQATLTAKRRLGQRTLEFIISGYATLEQAEAALRHQLPELIKLRKTFAKAPSVPLT